MQQFCGCEISGIETALASTYDKSCEIQRNNATQGSLGYNNAGWTTIGFVNVGLKAPSANILALYAEQIGDQLTWQVRLPMATDVVALDQLVIEGQTLIVQAILTPQSFDFEINLLASQVRGLGRLQVG